MKPSHRIHLRLCWSAALALLVATGAVRAEETNLAAAFRTEATNSAPSKIEGTNLPVVARTEGPAIPAKTSYETFKVIVDRNIFSPRKSGRETQVAAAPKKSVRVDSFSVTGTLSYSSGWVAFFDGTSSRFRKSVKAGQTFEGFKVKDVTLDGVKLEKDQKVMTVRVGGQVKREDDGPWHSTAPGERIQMPESKSEAGGDSREPSGGESDILKRLMEKAGK